MDPTEIVAGKGSENHPALGRRRDADRPLRRQLQRCSCGIVKS